MKTTEFIPARKIEYHNETCHGGKGPWFFNDMLADLKEKKYGIRFIHYDKLPPGSEFGIHNHKQSDTEEWYICLIGHGIMTLDGVDYPFGPGDLTVCRGNGSHGIRNNSSEMMEFLVINCLSK